MKTFEIKCSDCAKSLIDCACKIDRNAPVMLYVRTSMGQDDQIDELRTRLETAKTLVAQAALNFKAISTSPHCDRWLKERLVAMGEKLSRELEAL